MIVNEIVFYMILSKEQWFFLSRVLWTEMEALPSYNFSSYISLESTYLNILFEISWWEFKNRCHLNCVSMFYRKFPFDKNIFLFLWSLHTVLVIVFIDSDVSDPRCFGLLNHNNSSFWCWFSLVSVGHLFSLTWTLVTRREKRL